jgi:DNA primase large subunit
MLYFMESATIIIFFARLVHFQGERGCEKEYSLYACDNDEKDGRPLIRCTHDKNLEMIQPLVQE